MVTKPDLPETIEGWNDLSTVLDHFSQSNNAGWLFRGVTDAAYDLVPKVGRERRSTRNSKRVAAYSPDDEIALLDLFRQRARANAGAVQSKLEWMALAQHYGVPTRMLDWSERVLVATWFAVQDPDPPRPNCDAAIWIAKGVTSVEHDSQEDPLEMSMPAIYRPPHFTSRIGAQGSVMMVCPKPTKPAALGHCQKIEIASGQRFKLRKRLDACGINAMTLFGDLAGVGNHLAWTYANDWLVGYRR